MEREMYTDIWFIAIMTINIYATPNAIVGCSCVSSELASDYLIQP